MQRFVYGTIFQLSLAIAIGPAFAQSTLAKKDSKAQTRNLSSAKDSEAQEKTESEQELLKELNIQEPQTVHGFHPIKQTMNEMSEIASINLRLYEQMKKLEIPVSGLQPTMLQLQNTMLHVDKQMDVTHTQLSSVSDQMTAMFGQMGKVGDKMGSVQEQIGTVGEKIDAMHSQLGSVGQKIKGMHEQLASVQGQVKQMEIGMTGLRDDLKAIRSDLTAVRTQVNGLQRPIEQIRDPLLEVAGPLEGLGQRLDRLQALVSNVLTFIVLAAVGIAIGTPLAAFLIHRLFFQNRPAEKNAG